MQVRVANLLLGAIAFVLFLQFPRLLVEILHRLHPLIGRQRHALCRCKPRTFAVLNNLKQAVREAATICPTPCKLTCDLLTLKVVSESRVTWATSVPILVFLGLTVLHLGPMYATDVRQTSESTRIIA